MFLESNGEAWATLFEESPSKSSIDDKTFKSDDTEDKSDFHNARKRLASQIEDVEFMRTIRNKLQKIEPTEKEQLKREILDMLNKN